MQRNDRDGYGYDGQAPTDRVPMPDRLVWQRLVDNRLNDQEYRQLLLDLETRPGLWRDCALAFLEDQAMRQALRHWSGDAEGGALVAGSASRPGRTRGGLVSTSLVPTVGGQAADLSPTEVQAAEWRSGPGSWSQPFLVTVSLAAGFVLAMFAFSQYFSDRGSPAADSRLGVATGQPVVPVGEPLVMDRESFKDFLADLPPEQRRELFQRPTQQRVSPTVAARPASLVPGQVQAERRFLFYRTADGGMIVVPVDDYRFVAQEFQ